MTRPALPNPGSDDAVALGCKCPVMDNCRGRGIPTDGGVCFYYSDDCPMHGRAPMQAPAPDVRDEIAAILTRAMQDGQGDHDVIALATDDLVALLGGGG